LRSSRSEIIEFGATIISLSSTGKAFLDTYLPHSWKERLGKENGGRSENGKQVPMPDSAGCHEFYPYFLLRNITVFK
jgi:hypothetical protein